MSDKRIYDEMQKSYFMTTFYKITAELHHPAHLERRLSEFTHSYADTWSYLTPPLSLPNKQEDKIEFLK